MVPLSRPASAVFARFAGVGFAKITTGSPAAWREDRCCRLVQTGNLATRLPLERRLVLLRQALEFHPGARAGREQPVGRFEKLLAGAAAEFLAGRPKCHQESGNVAIDPFPQNGVE